MERKRREIVKGEEENLKWKGERGRYETEERSHFLKPLKFVWGVPKMEISTGEKAFHSGKKIVKCDFAPL